MDDIKILERFVRLHPKNGLSIVAEAIGPGPAAVLMRSLAGKVLYLPRQKTLFLTGLPLIIEQHTAGLVGAEKKKALKELSKVYNIPVFRLKKFQHGNNV